MRVVWDREKDRQNQKKHDVSFEDAEELIAGTVNYLEIFDEDHSVSEARFICIGPIRRGLIGVVTAEPDEAIVRILSARTATRREAAMHRRYMEGKLHG
jgi:uncharacterized DUF497 family protein